MAKERSLLSWNWQRTLLVVVAIIAVLQLFRANRSEKHPQALPPASRYSSPGPIVDGRVHVPAGDFVSYRIDLNRPATVRGNFWSGDKAVEITCILTDAERFEAWKSGTDGTHIVNTGEVPAGQVGRKIGPGTFYLVLSNRSGNSEKLVNANFVLE